MASNADGELLEPVGCATGTWPYRSTSPPEVPTEPAYVLGGRPRPLLHDQVPSVGEFIGRAKASGATATLDGPAKANRSWC